VEVSGELQAPTAIPPVLTRYEVFFIHRVDLYLVFKIKMLLRCRNEIPFTQSVVSRNEQFWLICIKVEMRSRIWFIVRNRGR